MEQWEDQAIVLSARAHGENGAIVNVLTEQYGRHAGYVRGARSKSMRGVLEAGNLVGVRWSARTSDNLGSYTIEQERNLTSAFMHDPLRLSACMAACGLSDTALPEREGHPGLFHGLKALLENLDSDIWGASYVLWEIALLKELGFGLDLTRCAGGGDGDDLYYVSPKSGHAVSRSAGEPYKDKLLALPAFLRPVRGAADDEEILRGLELTGYFLNHWVFAHHTHGVPESRLRFQERFAARLADKNPSEATG